jgi:uncharacterized membrane protein
MDVFAPLAGMAALTVSMDSAWLYANHANHVKLFERIQKSPLTIRWIPAAMVYVLIIAAVYVAAVQPSTSFTHAALAGAGLGLAMYGVYDLTNFATLTDYTLAMTLTDMAWGTVLCGAIATAGFGIKSLWAS